MALATCFGDQTICVIQPECRLAGVLSEALDAFLAVLDRFSLADLVERPNAIAALLEPVRS
jgi:Rrf2 family nitric oxide-sensitive transcriptional repressor